MRGLVLGAGGVAGIAWELGVLLGIRDAQPDLVPRIVDAELVVGTSAGAAVGAQITSGTDLQQLYDLQLRQETDEIEVDFDADALARRYEDAVRGISSPIEACKRLGQFALAGRTVSETERRSAVQARLPIADWPRRRLVVVAVDASTGEPETFTGTGQAGLIDAVAASCAVPGIWPPVTIGRRRFIDGGVRSSTNVDLAAGCDRVLVLLPTLPGSPSVLGDLSAAVVPPAGAQVLQIRANLRSVAAFGRNPLSPATRSASAQAGRAVGRAKAAQVAQFWA